MEGSFEGLNVRTFRDVGWKSVPVLYTARKKGLFVNDDVGDRKGHMPTVQPPYNSQQPDKLKLAVVERWLLFGGSILLGVVSLWYILRPRKGKEIPGPRGWPFIGCLLEVNQANIIRKSFEFAKTYGDVVKISICGQTIVFLNSVDVISKAFCGEKYKQFLNDRPRSYFGEHYLAGKGVVTCTDGTAGSLHGKLRKLAVRGLHAYGDGVQVFEDKVMSELAGLMGRIKKCGENDWEVVSTLESSIANILTILLTGEHSTDVEGDATAFREFNDSIDVMINPPVDAVLTIFPLIRYIPGKFKNVCDRFENARAQLLKRYYTAVKSTFRAGHVRGYVDFLLNEQQQAVEANEELVLTDEIIVSLVQEFVVAGFSTTRGALSSLFLCLLVHPEYQLKIQKELDDVIGNRLPTFGDRSSCPVIQSVIMESLRLTTVTALIAPHTTYQQLNFEGFILPKNSIILGNQWYICHDKKIWGDPWTFRPERFLDQNGQLLPRDHVLRRSWLTFGLGKRQCMGESFAQSRIFLYVATLLQRWKLIPSRDTCSSCDPRSDQFIYLLFVHPKPFYCRVEERK